MKKIKINQCNFFPEAQGDIFKLLGLSGPQPETQGIQLIITNKAGTWECWAFFARKNKLVANYLSSTATH